MGANISKTEQTNDCTYTHTHTHTHTHTQTRKQTNKQTNKHTNTNTHTHTHTHTHTDTHTHRHTLAHRLCSHTSTDKHDVHESMIMGRETTRRDAPLHAGVVLLLLLLLLGGSLCRSWLLGWRCDGLSWQLLAHDALLSRDAVEKRGSVTTSITLL